VSSASSRRFIVIGPGATGGTLAAELTRQGSDVLLVARGAEFDAISAAGLVYHTPDGTEVLPIPVVDGPESVELTPDDVLIITAKVQDVEPALRQWAWQPVVAADGEVTTAARTIPLVTVQNGLNAERVALRWFSTVYAGTIGCPGGKTTVGEVTNYGTTVRALLWLGTYPQGGDAVLDSIAAELRAGGRIAVDVVQDIRTVKAWKLSVITHNSTEAVFAASPLRAELDERLRVEAVEILTAAGTPPAEIVDGHVSGLDIGAVVMGDVEGQPRPGSSTLQSYTRGAPLETDYLNGEIVLLARLLGLTAPLNEALQLLIQVAVAGGRDAGALGDDALAELLS